MIFFFKKSFSLAMNKFPFLIIYQQQKQLRSPPEILSNLVAIQRPTQPVIQPLSDNIKESVLEDKVSECLNFYVVIINYLLFYAFTTIMPLLNNLINLFIFYFCNCLSVLFCHTPQLITCIIIKHLSLLGLRSCMP